MDADVATLPGFRRRVVVTPGDDTVTCALEDDYHRMRLAVRHAGGNATAVQATIERAPWTTCPGAEAELSRTFVGVPLAGFARRGTKSANCTHLHDMALLAGAHGGDAVPLVYDVLVSDAIDGVRIAELRRDGATVMRWEETRGVLTSPSEVAGLTLFGLRDWIAALDASGQEAARLLRWTSIVAHGRAIPMAVQSDPYRSPDGSCFTFQPERKPLARRIGVVREFSTGAARPLD